MRTFGNKNWRSIVVSLNYKNTIIMETLTIRDNVKYLTDAKGKATAIVFELKNKKLANIIDDILDLYDIEERKNEPTRPFAEVDAEIMSMHKIESCTK